MARFEPKTAREKFERLIRDAETFEKYSDPDSSAGPTFWGEIDTVTRRAIGLNCIGGQLAPESENLHFSEHPELREALSSAYGELKQQIWRLASKRLRDSAARMKAELRKESAEISALADALDAASPSTAEGMRGRT